MESVESVLNGVRVLELATGFAGPYCGRLLADLGADMLKAEPPGGDEVRARGPFAAGEPSAPGLFFTYLNRGKREAVLHLRTEREREAFLATVAGVDVVVEDFAPGVLTAAGLSVAELRRQNPELVVVSLTPFGLTGPKSAWQANDMITFHSSGFAFGFPSHEVESFNLPPLNAPSHAAHMLAGETAAAAVLHGLLVRQATGAGVHIDLSLQEAVAAEQQTRFNDIDADGAFKRVLATTPGNAVVALFPCTDGWVAVSPREEHQWVRWLDLLGNPAWAADERFATRASRNRSWDALYPLVAAWTAGRSKGEVFQLAQSARVPCFPIGTAGEVLESPQLAARGFFGTADDAGPRLPQQPYRIRAASATAADPAQNVRARSRGRESDGPPVVPAAPLRGLRVVDFTWVMMGPICTRYLAALGAEVIKVESAARPDLSRRDDAWESLNPGKRSLTLNLKTAEGRDIARRLISVSDVVVENFSNGVMERLGLDYDSLSAANPRLIMASSSSMGATGPDRDLVAYGTLLQCLSGWASLSAWPGHPPRSPGSPWTDPVSAVLEMVLLLAAVHRQRATGKGCSIDISMLEATVAVAPESILRRVALGVETESIGNRDRMFAPQGCYPADGDDTWLAISVQDDSQWRSLCQQMERGDLAADIALSTAAGRQEHHDKLDVEIAAWTRGYSAEALAARLQAAGVPATATLNPADGPADEHLLARGFYGEIERLSGGSRLAPRVPWIVDGERPENPARPPDLGADNDYVLRELLDLDEANCARLVADRVIY